MYLLWKSTILLDCSFYSFVIPLIICSGGTRYRRYKMSTLDATRVELTLITAYLNKSEARDKICRAIQYGSKFLSDGKPGTAQNVDKSTSLARKLFRLFKVSSNNMSLASL